MPRRKAESQAAVKAGRTGAAAEEEKNGKAGNTGENGKNAKAAEKAKGPSPSGKKKAGAVSFCVDHVPFRDWNSWNQPVRILVPLFVLTLVLVFSLEYLLGGNEEVLRLSQGGFLHSALILLALSFLFTGAVLLLRGADVLDCSCDSQGIHMEIYLPRPTPLKLLARFRSPDLTPGEDGMVFIESQDVAWNSVTRVQLWPETTSILIYHGAACLTLPCTPFSYEPVLQLIREKLGKKQHVRLPRELRDPALLQRMDRPAPKKAGKKKRRAASREPSPRQGAPKSTTPRLTPEFLADIQRMNAEDEAAARRKDAKHKQR